MVDVGASRLGTIQPVAGFLDQVQATLGEIGVGLLHVAATFGTSSTSLTVRDALCQTS
jgi:hypothetical protein